MDKFLRPSTIIKDCDLPEELKAESSDVDGWAYASVETIDRDEDIVRVAGISLKNHRPESPLKLLAGHLRVLPDGSSPIIGAIQNFKQITHKSLGVPALAFSWKFATTPLGKHYRQLMDDGCFPDLSIGFRPTKAEPLKDGGLDYQACELLEVSAVTIPANPHAHAAVMRALEETYPEARKNGVSDLVVRVVPEVTGPDFTKALHEAVKPLIDMCAAFPEFQKQINSRLDDLEDAIVGAPKGAEPDADHTPPPASKSDSEVTPTLADLVNAIKALTPRK